MKPSIPITDKRFVYVPASHTDIRETFKRVRERDQAEQLKVNGSHPWALVKGKK